MPERSLAQQATELAASVESLGVSVATLADRVDTHQTLISRNVRHLQKAVAVTVVGLILDLSLTVFGGYLYFQQKRTSDDLQVVQARTSAAVLCPLYRVLIDSISANPAPPNQTPEQIKFREGAIVTIRNGYSTLGCH